MSKSKRIAIDRITMLMDFWHITVDDLQSAADPAQREAAAPPDSAPAAKYRHPLTGETWDGLGTQPVWLREALLVEGYRVEELRVPQE